VHTRFIKRGKMLKIGFKILFRAENIGKNVSVTLELCAIFEIALCTLPIIV
jgi:hypothetical protein